MEESTHVAKITCVRSNLLLGKIPPLHFISVGITYRGVVPFIRTGYIRYVAWRWIIAATLRNSIQPHRLYMQRGGRQIAAPTGVVPFIHTGYNRNVPGTAHRPFPTVSLIGVVFNQCIFKTGTSVPTNCQLSTVNLEKLSIVN